MTCFHRFFRTIDGVLGINLSELESIFLNWNQSSSVQINPSRSKLILWSLNQPEWHCCGLLGVNEWGLDNARQRLEPEEIVFDVSIETYWLKTNIRQVRLFSRNRVEPFSFSTAIGHYSQVLLINSTSLLHFCKHKKTPSWANRHYTLIQALNLQT